MSQHQPIPKTAFHGPHQGQERTTEGNHSGVIPP